MKRWVHCFEDDCQGSEGTTSPYCPCLASSEASLNPCTWTEKPHFSSAWALSPCPSVPAPVMQHECLSSTLPLSLSPGQTLDPGCSHVSNPVLVSCWLMDPGPSRSFASLRLSIDPVTAPGSIHCGQTLRDSALSVGAPDSLGSPWAPKSLSPRGQPALAAPWQWLRCSIIVKFTISNKRQNV